MEPDFSREALKKFFEYLANKGLVNPNTVAARKAAANKMLSVLDGQEASDLRSVDLDRVATQFFNLHGKHFTPDSMVTYKSRLKSGIDDFIKYTTNPSSFKPDAPRPRSATKVEGHEPKNGSSSNGTNSSTNESSSGFQQNENIFPIPVRQGLVVKLIGLPSDLTKKEAQKIANVVMAFAVVDDD